MELSLVEASIAHLEQALSAGSISCVELVAKYLHRIAKYDCRGPCLNSIVILNPDVFDEAAASDARRATHAVLGPLDGIPYTLKDSMKYKGMTCATGSPAFANLVASDDCFVAEQLRKAGAICIGRTNTPPMMASGMHRGLYGRAESPYNLDYLTAAFSSGSSNGAASSTAASFAAFGLGSETVSSGRSPASNNALVAYSPSRTVISPRGVWPLYPTCDVLVPMTRTVKDMLRVLNVLTIKDRTTDGDFWREQRYVSVPDVQRPRSYLDLLEGARESLGGRRIGVPSMYIGGRDVKAKPTVVSQDVLDLWRRAREDLESLGAIVIETDFPLVTNYEDNSISGHTNNVVGFRPDWNSKERDELVAFLWDDFLKANGEPGLAAVDGSQMFPRPEGYIPDRYMETKNFINYPGLVELAKTRDGKRIWDVDGIAEALPALEAQRKRDLDDWMEKIGIDLVVFPANGDVGKADLDTNDESARHALQNGVKYSNGNRALRHLGVPTVSVTMGIMCQSRMPVNLTFIGKHGQDSELLRYAFAFEQHKQRRVAPALTPALDSDIVRAGASQCQTSRSSEQLVLSATAKHVDTEHLRVSGEVSPATADTIVQLFVNGQQTCTSPVLVNGTWSMESQYEPFHTAKPLYGGMSQLSGKVMLTVLATSSSGVAAKLLLIDQITPHN